MDLKKEGFWYSKDEPNLPMPIHTDMVYPLRDKILAAFDAADKNPMVEKIYYKGWSNCRCCQQTNGTYSLVFNGWEWPSGYRHYVAEHNLVPTTEFMEEALGMSFD